MKIEGIRLKNFKAFQEIQLSRLPQFCIFVGANGSGKSSLFQVLEFLKEAISSNVTTALSKIGGGRGFDEVRTRGATGSIEIQLKFREDSGKPLTTYTIEIVSENGRVIVEREILEYRRGSHGKPWRFLDFRRGQGQAVINEVDRVVDEQLLKREEQVLKAPDLLAVKGLAQFKRFPAAVALGNLIENWHLSDFHIQSARPEQLSGYSEHLSREGENLSIVIQYLYQQHPDTFGKILRRLERSIPGISQVEVKTTEEGRVLLKFQDKAFEDPFLARFVSDGTIKMLAYLVLLYDPNPHPLLCVEEPENQLYPQLFAELADEFRSYAKRGGQVFVTSHSPDFLNAAELEEVFWITKMNGISEVRRASDDPQITAYVRDEGEKLGYLWRHGLFKGADPQ